MQDGVINKMNSVNLFLKVEIYIFYVLNRDFRTERQMPRLML